MTVWEAIIERAKEYYADNQYASVVELLNPLLDDGCRRGFAWFMLGDSLRVLGRCSEAQFALMQSLSLAPDHKKCRVHVLLALLAGSVGQLAEAENWHQCATRSQEAQEEAFFWVFRGGNLARLERFEEAAECHRRATQLRGAVDEAWLNLGFVLRAQRKYDEALHAFRQALEITPDYPEALQAIAELAEIHDAIRFMCELDATDASADDELD
jgi:tetratricopeptide (TPR) repeat protein